MKKVLYFTIASAVLFSCENQPVESNIDHSTEEVSEKAVVVEPNQLATIEVKGMECVMACGGSIKKALRKTQGVSNIEFDFEMGREFNIATISYDENVVTMDEMKALILDLNNEQFSIGNLATEEIHAKANCSENTAHKSSSEAKIEVSNSSFEMPNLVDLFSGFLPV